MDIDWVELQARCERIGLSLRGGLHVGDDDEGLTGAAGAPAGTLALLGNVGPLMWRAFTVGRGSASAVPLPMDRGSAPPIPSNRAPAAPPGLGLDDWTRAVVSPLAAELGARAIFPFEGPPYWPFQRWAQRAEPVFPSPLGILIHPRFGLWHGYRAALVFTERLPLSPREEAASPYASCAEKPCLSACPVGAFSPAKYDVAACTRHLVAQPAAACMEDACLARRACPVGQDFIYPEEQRRFHMRAFARQWSSPGAPESAPET
jgi:hypothetical protein